MKAIPADLTHLNQGIGSRASLWPNSTDAGWAVAFLRICKALEPNLVFSSDEDRRDWLKGVGEIEFHLSKIDVGERAKVLGVKVEVYKRLSEIADRCWRGSSASARELPFIQDPDLRRIAERDLASLSNAQRAEETKTALILAGSVVEAILWDVVEGCRAKDSSGTEAKAAQAKVKLIATNPRWKGFDPKDDERWTLEQLVGVCGPHGLGVLSERAVLIAHAIRDFRNLVHPRKELREQQENGPIIPSDAPGAAALMESVIDQVARWRAATP